MEENTLGVDIPTDMLIDIYAAHNLGVLMEISLFAAICNNIPADFENKESIEAVIAGWKEWKKRGGSREDFQK